MSGTEQFEGLEEGTPIRINLRDTGGPNVTGSTAWREENGLSRPYKESIVGRFKKTKWFGKRPSEVVIFNGNVEYSIEIPDILEWSLQAGADQSDGTHRKDGDCE